MSSIAIIGLVILGVAVCIGGAMIAGAYRWNAETKWLRTRLEANRTLIRPPIYDPQELESLPPPVQRYLRAVLREGQPLVAAANLQQNGAMNMSERGEHWTAFTATQRVVTRRTGFDWDARISMLPGVVVRVHDAYAAGEGILHAALLGLVTVAEAGGTPQSAEGELMRFLAEAPWYPTALLPSQGVRWEPVGGTAALATIADGNATVSLRFEFNETGLIDSVHADARWRTVKEEPVSTPWTGRFRHYEIHGGMQVPMEAEVAWLLPQGWKPYWRGHITGLDYEFAQ